MKKIISSILVVMLLCTYCIVFANENDAIVVGHDNFVTAKVHFLDMNENHFSYEAALNLYNAGFIKRDSEGRIHPEELITREQAVKIALAINKVDVEQGLSVAAPDFNKVSEWAVDVMATAYKYGVIRGDEDGSLRPTDYVTRAELIAIVMRALNVQVSEVEVDFSDVTAEDWYYTYVGIAAELGLVGGFEDGTFKPENKITRADSFVIFDRVYTLRTALENAYAQ